MYEQTTVGKTLPGEQQLVIERYQRIVFGDIEYLFNLVEKKYYQNHHGVFSDDSRMYVRDVAWCIKWVQGWRYTAPGG